MLRLGLIVVLLLCGCSQAPEPGPKDYHNRDLREQRAGYNQERGAQRYRQQQSDDD